jgi:hypothetical protein
MCSHLYICCAPFLFMCVLRQHTSAYLSIPQHTSAYLILTSAYVRIRQHTSAYASIYMCCSFSFYIYVLLVRALVYMCPDTILCVLYVCSGAGLRRAHQYAVCWRMLTYADVCWRMLTYADVCWRMLRRRPQTRTYCRGALFFGTRRTK